MDAVLQVDVHHQVDVVRHHLELDEIGLARQANALDDALERLIGAVDPYRAAGAALVAARAARQPGQGADPAAGRIALLFLATAPPPGLTLPRSATPGRRQPMVALACEHGAPAPEALATAARPPSSAATRSSSAATVGLLRRE